MSKRCVVLVEHDILCEIQNSPSNLQARTVPSSTSFHTPITPFSSCLAPQDFTASLDDGGADAGQSVPLRLNVQPPAWDDFSSGEDSDQEDDERPLTREELKRKTLRSGVTGPGVSGTVPGGGGMAGGGAGTGVGSGNGGGVGNKAKDGKVKPLLLVLGGTVKLIVRFSFCCIVVSVKSKGAEASAAGYLHKLTTTELAFNFCSN